MASGQMYSGGDGMSHALTKTPSMTQSSVMQSPSKEVNPVTMCKHGQEMTHEIVQKCQDIFLLLKQTQVPNGVSVTMPNYNDKKAKLTQTVKMVKLCFQHLHSYYNKVNEATVGLENVQAQKLIPYKEEGVEDGLSVGETAKYSSEEHRELVQQVQAKNEQLKEIIDQIRTAIWDINTMMAMRRM